MTTTQPDSSATYVPSTPDPQVTVLVAALIRHVLSLLSGAGLVVGTYSDSTIEVIAGAVVGIAVTAWSIYEKLKAAKQDHAGSVRSAIAGTAVKAV